MARTYTGRHFYANAGRHMAGAMCDGYEAGKRGKKRQCARTCKERPEGHMAVCADGKRCCCCCAAALRCLMSWKELEGAAKTPAKCDCVISSLGAWRPAIRLQCLRFRPAGCCCCSLRKAPPQRNAKHYAASVAKRLQHLLLKSTNHPESVTQSNPVATLLHWNGMQQQRIQ